ncbi:MAG: CopD family protein [Gammaproteobacteria bacterium]
MWATVNVTSKFFYLLGSAAVIGGLPGYFLLRGFDRQLLTKVFLYMALGALVGALASVCYFLAQVGAINDAGVRGMFDWSMAGMLADTNLGLAAAWRIAGLLLGLSIVVVLIWEGHSLQFMTPQAFGVAALSMLMFGMLAMSFPLVGHVSTLSLPFKALLSAHVFTVLLWTGSLLPLWIACSDGSPEELKLIMERYGKVAAVIVLVVLVSGAIIIFQLLNNVSEMVSTAYGRGLLIKLLGVCLLLLLAARHKFILVPNLNSEAEMFRLQRSIAVEIAIGVCVLAATSYSTTAVGPSMGH